MELCAENVSRMYFRMGRGTNVFNAVEPTDFSLTPGALTGILGPSGSGKTTFAQLLGGLLSPSSGRVILDGRDLYALDDRERSELRNRALGIVPQGQSGLCALTVLENVLAPAAMYGRGKEKRERARVLLAVLGIGELENVYADELSGGELRRMAVARALINDPPILIADEPTSDLDGEAAELVLKLLKSRTGAGASVLMVTHDGAAVPYADLLFRMEKGVLRQA